MIEPRIPLAVVTAGLTLALVSGCGSTATATPDATPTTTTTTAAHHGDARTDRSMGGMDGMTKSMDGGLDGMDGAGGMDSHQHSAALPPLASRLAAATATERAAAADLLARTGATLQAYESEPAARADGFVPNPGSGRLIHYRNVANRRDGHALDPEHPEGLVYVATITGELRLLGAVFTVRASEAAPTPGGEIFRWHTHDPSCPTFLVASGACQDTFRMLHVWTTDAVTVVDPWNQMPRAAFGRV